ncbi:hypothetical protein [Nonomuraea typhae]|uniref:hypothetical protein n=1 Tax=Nonomuraea typhae TaxID=2603600 RepID=UPI0012FA7BDA|nr:hypothetical protein [Nonomuraea typhae]
MLGNATVGDGTTSRSLDLLSSAAGATWHNRISIEVPDQTGALQSALEIPFAPWNVANGYGIAAQDVYVRAIAKLIAGSVPMIVEGAPGTSTCRPRTAPTSAARTPTAAGRSKATTARRAAQFGSLGFATEAGERWAVGLRNDSTDDLHIRNTAQGVTGSCSKTAPRRPT